MNNKKLSTGQVIGVRDLRERYRMLVKKLGKVSVIKALALGDEYYNSVEGYNDYKSLQKGVAGLEKTAKGVQTLETFFEANPQVTRPRYLKKLHLPS